jgi:transcriptional regulator with XRE-family HTH domain
MERPLKSYLRTFRRRWGFTQKELAFLLGLESATTVSRVEQLKRLPSLGSALACLIVFETTAIEIFPALFAEIREAVRDRANQLYEELQGDPSTATRIKLDFLEELLSDADNSATNV